MIKKISINGLYGKPNFSFTIQDNLTLLTGDNGSGKTTILNIVYNILISEYTNLFKFKFEALKIVFEDNPIQLTFIEVIRKKSFIEIKYQFLEKEHLLKVEKSQEVNRYSIKYLSKEEIIDDSDDEYDGFWGPLNYDFEDFLERNPELKFVNEIKNSILYFPTFRRIDSDLKNIYESTSYGFEKDLNFDLDEDRIVMGIDNNEIKTLFDSYSNVIRKFNSEGLDELLKEFIKTFIGSIYKDKNEYKSKLNIKDYDTAANNLLELIDKLGIAEDLSNEEIKKYFLKQNEVIKKSNQELKKMELMKLENRKNELNISEMADGFKLLIGMIQSLESNMVLFQLISLYGDHLNEQEKLLEPIRYLKKGFELFFKGKVNIIFDEKNYGLYLSEDFDILSTGEKQMISLLSFIGLMTKNNVFQPLVIIDEPELSLHISWQKKLLPFLMEKGDRKFLITTHSPYIASINYRKFVKQLGDIDEYN